MAPWWLVLPSRCAVCGRTGDPLCAPCERSLVRLAPPWCERCGTPGPWPVRRCVECAGRRLAFTHARAAVAYDRLARRFVVAWKEHGRRDLARVAALLVQATLPAPVVEAITWVPGDRERTRRRGHVPARALARELGCLWGLPAAPLLARTRRVGRQRGLTLADRRRNVRGVFAATARSPPAVCLVDDIYTTGATADACARELRRAGARRVEVICLARAVR